jgi:hypothetical protein
VRYRLALTVEEGELIPECEANCKAAVAAIDAR